jgi:hypothetical protein
MAMTLTKPVEPVRSQLLKWSVAVDFHRGIGDLEGIPGHIQQVLGLYDGRIIIH